ncbi:hypothetical protein VPNG_00005 [Cytospora leucostoma]|uniref:Uncharacterized protein n=1 Tax=Cytospora leucostoma TaxID=1230097 RepID=A0A423XNW2_9PEZI|nr:hypothetical protein VPNG_00005 [Cytospora leucostoma]
MAGPFTSTLAIRNGQHQPLALGEASVVTRCTIAQAKPHARSSPLVIVNVNDTPHGSPVTLPGPGHFSFFILPVSSKYNIIIAVSGPGYMDISQQPAAFLTDGCLHTAAPAPTIPFTACVSRPS